MKQFNLEEYLKGPTKNIITRNGLPVRIICTDKQTYGITKFPIVCLIKEEYGETISVASVNGKCDLSETTQERDLFFAPTKKEGWINIYPHNRLGGNIHPTKEMAEKSRRDDGIDTIKIEWEE